MQQQTPPRGRLFPDPPQAQTQAPRFSSTGAQPYEPQPRMQQTGAYPTYHSARYSTNSLQTLHVQPVQTLPPMSTMPTAQTYQTALAQSQLSQQMKQNPSLQQTNPLIVQTVQGTPVVVSMEQLEEALRQQKEKQGDSEKAESTGKDRKERKAEKKQKKEKKEKATVVKTRPSLFWIFFGLIGIATVLYLLYGQVIVPLRYYLYSLTSGGGL